MKSNLLIGFSSVQSLSYVRVFATPWTAAHQAFPVRHQLLELAQTHVHQVGNVTVYVVDAYEVLFWGDKNLLELEFMVSQHCKCTKCRLIVHFKMVNFVTCTSVFLKLVLRLVIFLSFLLKIFLLELSVLNSNLLQLLFHE